MSLSRGQDEPHRLAAPFGAEVHLGREAALGTAERLVRLEDLLGLLVERTDIIMPTLEELQAKADETLANVTAETDLDKNSSRSECGEAVRKGLGTP